MQNKSWSMFHTSHPPPTPSCHCSAMGIVANWNTPKTSPGMLLGLALHRNLSVHIIIPSISASGEMQSLWVSNELLPIAVKKSSLIVSHTSFHLLCMCVHCNKALLITHRFLFAPDWEGQALDCSSLIRVFGSAQVAKKNSDQKRSACEGGSQKYVTIPKPSMSHRSQHAALGSW